MKKFKIEKGKHRVAQWWQRLWRFRFINSTNGQERVIQFDESWRNSDQNAIHKLFGFSNGWNHHKTSFRFGAKYDAVTDKMMIYAYCYIGGQRVYEPLQSVAFNKPIRLKVAWINNVFEGSYYAYEINGRSNIVNGVSMNRVKVPYKLPKFGWFLGLYHGGNIPAPVELVVYSNKYL
jgi:hypothetical protein